MSLGPIDITERAVMGAGIACQTAMVLVSHDQTLDEESAAGALEALEQALAWIETARAAVTPAAEQKSGLILPADFQKA